MSALAIEDVVKPNFKSLSERTITLIAKISVVFIGALCVAVSFLIAKIKGPMSQISSSVLAAFGGPASGLFLFSVFCPWGNAKGAIIGTLLTAVVGMWISTGQNFSTTLKRAPGLPPGPIDRCIDVFPNKLSNMTEQTTPWTAFYHSTVESSTEYETKSLHKPKGLDRFYSLSYQWLTGFLIIVSLILCSAASIISGRPDPASVDVRYMLPFFDQFFPFLPKNIRKRLHGGVPFEKREEMLEKMNVWNYEKTYNDNHLDKHQTDEINEEVDDKTTELYPLTGSAEESSKSPSVNVEMSSSVLENGTK